MKQFEAPTPFGNLEEAGRDWAQERALRSATDEIELSLRGVYLAGVLQLWHAHQTRLQAVVAEAGGVKKVHTVAFSGGLNSLELESGRHMYASEIFNLPELKVSSWKGKTLGVEKEYEQRHALTVGFGGSMMGGVFETNEYSVNGRQHPSVSLKDMVLDDSFFPEEIGLSESMSTRMDGDKKYEAEVMRANYSLYGRVWGSNLFSQEPMPDPYTDPVAYRRWALAGNTHLELFFNAPTQEGTKYPTSQTVIGQYHQYRPDVKTAVVHLERFRSLLAYYALNKYPDLFPHEENANEFGRIAQPLLELEQ